MEKADESGPNPFVVKFLTPNYVPSRFCRYLLQAPRPAGSSEGMGEGGTPNENSVAQMVPPSAAAAAKFFFTAEIHRSVSVRSTQQLGLLLMRRFEVQSYAASSRRVPWHRTLRSIRYVRLRRFPSCGGNLLIVLGMAAVGSPFLAAVAVNVAIAWLIVLAGSIHLILPFRAHGAGSMIWKLLVGVAYICFGIYLILHPVLARGIADVNSGFAFPD